MRAKTSSNCLAIFVKCRLVPEMEWCGEVRVSQGHWKLRHSIERIIRVTIMSLSCTVSDMARY